MRCECQSPRPPKPVDVLWTRRAHLFEPRAEPALCLGRGLEDLLVELVGSSVDLLASLGAALVELGLALLELLLCVLRVGIKLLLSLLGLSPGLVGLIGVSMSWIIYSQAVGDVRIPVP
jgi:hypothetical protein